jgi:nucleoid-associated protein YgaU
MVIYEANKDQIGDNPAHVRVGMEILIPELPENLKAKK